MPTLKVTLAADATDTEIAQLIAYLEASPLVIKAEGEVKDPRITHCDECGRQTDDLAQCGLPTGIVIDGVELFCDDWLCIDCDYAKG